MTQSNIILNVLRENRGEWFESYKLVKLSTKWGFLGTSADRRARELAEEDRIEVRHIGKYVQYRAKPKVHPPIECSTYDWNGVCRHVDF